MPPQSGLRQKRVRLVFIVVFVLLALPAHAMPARGRARPTIVFMSDFGLVDDSVAICKGVMLGIAPDLRIVDLTHEVRPYSIEDGARFLFGATPYYPPATVFVVVVDPTVGSARKGIVAKSRRGQYFVLPDNGLLTLVQDRDGIEAVREITNPSWMMGGKLSSTFHGRDVFSPVGAHLARGDDWTRVGPEIKDLVRLKTSTAQRNERGIVAQAIARDGPFGNIVTNITAEDFAQLGYGLGDVVPLNLAGKEIPLPFARTFSDVPVGKPLLYIDSRGRVALAVNQGNFATVYGVDPPQALTIGRKPAGTVAGPTK